MKTESPAALARAALACLDLTSLNDADDEAAVTRLCARAQSRFGHSAAVCVWPRFARLARSLLPPALRVAAAANFPAGGSDIDAALEDTRAIAEAGAQEVDLVLPWRELDAAPALVAAVRRECKGLTLKVILETGELRTEPAIRRAAAIALDGGADFLKTSTGRVAVNATPQAARMLLEAIERGGHARVGFKAAGGIRSVADAAPYLALADEFLGGADPARFRIGASSLLDDIEALLGGAVRPAPGRGY